MTRLAITIVLFLFIVGGIYFFQTKKNSASSEVSIVKAEQDESDDHISNVPEKTGVMVVAAKEPIKSGQKVTRNMLKYKWVENSKLPGYCTSSPYIFVGKYAYVDLEKDQIIRFGDIGVPKDRIDSFMK